MPSEKMKAIPNIAEFRIQQNNYGTFLTVVNRVLY